MKSVTSLSSTIVETTKKKEKYDSESDSSKFQNRERSDKRETSPFRPNSILRRSKSVFDSDRLGDKYSSLNKYGSFNDRNTRNYSTSNRDYNDSNYVSVLDRLGYEKYDKNSYNYNSRYGDNNNSHYNNNDRYKRSQSCAPSSSYSSSYYNKKNSGSFYQNQRERRDRRSDSPDRRYYWKNNNYNNNNSKYNNDYRYRPYTNVFDTKRNYRAQSCAPSTSSTSSSSSRNLDRRYSSNRIPLIVSDFQHLYYKSLDDVEVMASNKYREKTLLRATVKYLKSISENFEEESETVRNDCFKAGLLAYAFNDMVKTKKGKRTFYAFLSMNYNPPERYVR